MAITKSAKKALRQGLKRRTQNIQKKEKIKNLLKEVRSLVSQRKVAEAKKLLPQVYKLLDKAVKVGVVKKNTAARKKSRIIRLVSKFPQ